MKILEMFPNQEAARQGFNDYRPHAVWAKRIAPNLQIEDGEDIHYFFHIGETERLRGMEFTRVIWHEKVQPIPWLLERIR